MPEIHFEPYLMLAGLSHNAALVAWGGFYFRVRGKADAEQWKVVDDSDLDQVHPPRFECVGSRSTPYGHARVEVSDAAGAVVASAETATSNHVWLTGLEPDTTYTYRVTVNGEAWADGPRRDWVADETRQGLYRDDDNPRSYTNEFRTFPAPDQVVPLAFAIIGDYGVGIRKKPVESFLAKGSRPCQLEIARALDRVAVENDVRLILTTGDNIYARRILNLPIRSQGDEDDDWFFTYYQPYRYLINRIPVYPTVGNHDTAEMEENDDREQVIDNFYLRERFRGQEAQARTSIGPGLFYRFRFGALAEFVAVDTSRQSILPTEPRMFLHADHAAFLDASFPDLGGEASPVWRIPFGHHPPYCAGPRHENLRSMIEHLIPRFLRSGVRVFFAGHEHNYQHSRADGVEYFITGAAGKVREGTPRNTEAARTVAWASKGHFLLVRVDRDRMDVTPIGADGGPLEVDWPTTAPPSFPIEISSRPPSDSST
jgi:hypothetical protein